MAAEIHTPLNRGSYAELDEILELVEEKHIRRIVFAHQVQLTSEHALSERLTHAETREALDTLIECAGEFECRGVECVIATEENHADAIYQYLRLEKENAHAAQAAHRLLPKWGAQVRGAGVGIAGIDPFGDVHPDPHWTGHVLGNVRQAPFSRIWGASGDPLMEGLRNRFPHLKGRCAGCAWKKVCGGNLRVRAEAYYRDPWMEDPACYLTNGEIVQGNRRRF